MAFSPERSGAKVRLFSRITAGSAFDHLYLLPMPSSFNPEPAATALGAGLLTPPPSPRRAARVS
jgi:hypothetical protein